MVAAPVEELIGEAVLTRLDSPQLAAALAGRINADTELAALAERLANDRLKLDELAGPYADGQVSAREWMTARDPIQARVRDTERRLALASDSGALHGVVGNSEALHAQWESLGLDRRQAVVKAVLDHAVIGPGSRGAQALDVDRVRPQWRL